MFTYHHIHILTAQRVHLSSQPVRAHLSSHSCIFFVSWHVCVPRPTTAHPDEKSSPRYLRLYNIPDGHECDVSTEMTETAYDEAIQQAKREYQVGSTALEGTYVAHVSELFAFCFWPASNANKLTG